MALTATATSAFRREPGWDEVIVPTLRRRLEDESHALAKRMSAASIVSADGSGLSIDSFSQAGHSNIVYVSREKATSPSYQYPKPSGIPRPSFQQSRTDTTESLRRSGSNSGSYKRARTVSSPFSFENPSTANTTPPPPIPQAASRSNSPFTTNSQMKSTRIPVSRARAGSTSSNQASSLNGHAGGSAIRNDSRNGLSKLGGNHQEAMVDLWPVKEAYPTSSVGSRSTTALRTPRSQASELINEQPPFDPNSVSSRKGLGFDNETFSNRFDPPRMSSDSEERPFEHWYRGDVSRNGGVGELRVGKRQEMLDIANYGHTVRQASSRVMHTPGLRSRSNSRGRDMEMRTGGRTRADSLGARQSIYLDDDEQARVGAMVLDEQPLTDLDSDGEEEVYYDGVDEGVELPEDDDPQLSSAHGHSRSTTHSYNRDLSDSAFHSRIPTASQKSSTELPPQRVETPPMTQPALEPSPPSSPPRARTLKKSSLTAPESQQNSTRAKSPAASMRTVASTGTAGTKGRRSPGVNGRKPPPKKTVSKKLAKEDTARKSVAHYPAPEGDDIANAIPSWTQPIERMGNWDEVVLPTVARKKGLDGYEKADGSPKPKPPSPTVYEPAPGTFGLKNRPPRTNTKSEEIPMDEFGQRQEPPIPEEKTPQPPPILLPDSNTPEPPPSFNTRSRAESPAPFAHYVHDQPPAFVPEIKVARPPIDHQPNQMPEEEDQGAGCCKCVIM